MQVIDTYLLELQLTVSARNKGNMVLGPYQKSRTIYTSKLPRVVFQWYKGTHRLNFPEGTKETAYVSIKPTGDDNSMYMFLCEDLPVNRGGPGVIISEDFYLRNAKSAWVDTNGKSHDPKKRKKKPEDGKKTAAIPNDGNKTAEIPKDSEKTCEMPENKNNKMYPEPSGIQYLRKNNSDGEEKNVKREGIIINGNAIMTLKDI
ncbi:unnamed protein product [Mytilus edulis]|uniref:Uncharacterized protein n=1 Tax=Mytilus edulis TaxID=6550 RepID=A0A8S3UBX8_MYTED|nr:unnamed protein product [Mytilus edulis]